MRVSEESQSFHSTIGKWMKFNRESIRLKQEDVGQAIGVSYQQIHKYEKGLNRISASALFTLSSHFNWPVNTIFNEELWKKKL